MDTYSSGEELVIKARKPYTITKQRERWTEDEHNRFLEALKLYGRAWQRIEEHIGTKTAVQIRSHAQKFFSKLEKEALVKGVPIGQALDIDIPPPRPKRKPSNPYPRKTSIGAPTSQVGTKDGKLFTSVSSLDCKQALDLEKEPLPEKPNGDEKPENAKDNQDDNCSEVFTLHQEVHCSSVSSANRSSVPTPVALRNSSTLREFVPSMKRSITQDETNESYVTIELKGNQKLEKADAKQTIQDTGTSNGSKLGNHNVPHEKPIQGDKTQDLNCALPMDEMQATQNYPRHVPVQVVDGSLGTCAQTPSSDMSFQDSIFHPMGEVHGHHNPFTNPAASATTEHQNNVPRSSVNQSFPAFHPPFTPIHHNQDNYQSFLHMSSTFSSLIVSTLMQNPAAHAAATAVPPTDSGQAPAAKTEGEVNTLQNPPLQQLDPEYSEAVQAQHSASKLLIPSSSDSEESGGAKLNSGPKATDHENAVAATELHDSNKTKGRKLVDRSSCGSNSTSSSDRETDALEKQEKGKEEPKEPDANQSAADTSNRCCCSSSSRSVSYMNDSWKSVSEEGRLAFQALFSREVLPQSFSPPHDLKNKGNQKDNTTDDKQNANENDGNASQLDLNSQTSGSCSGQPGILNFECNNNGEGLLSIGLGYGKLKARRTGFKPYKRCSVEAKENRVANASSQGEEKGPKRIRLEGEASI
ncbi:protein cca1 [Quercus suber]|uniref:Protein cca1 n=1 Tax=Quercus suber TaxID=58331 RepID=A0AAW0KCK2_QUESU